MNPIPAEAASPRRASDAARYVECPHCHHEVMVRADCSCIACGKSHLDMTGVDPEKTLVTIENISRLPGCCFVCGRDTPRMQRFRWTYRISPYALPPWMIPLVVVMSFLPGSQYSSVERLRLPVCCECAKPARRMRPQSVRSGLECRLVVHRRFRARLEDLNGKSLLEWESDVRDTVQTKMKTPQVRGGAVRL